MIKIVHIADLHLDTPFSGSNLAERRDRRNELRNGLAAVCAYCREKGTQLLLIAGDMFEGDYTSRETASFVAQCFSSIPDTRVFIAPGNHDPFNSSSPYKYCVFPDNVHIFSEESLEVVEIPELSAAVYGYAFTGDKMSENPVGGLRPFDTKRINILVGHGDLDVPRSDYYNIKISDISASGLDYVALGHIHKPSGIMRIGSTYCAYSGCLIGRDFGECGKHGMIAGEISKENGAQLKYVPVTDATFEEIYVDTDGKNLDEVVNEIRDIRLTMPKECRVRAVLSGKDKMKLNAIRMHLNSNYSTDYKIYTIDGELFEDVEFEDVVDEFSMRGAYARKLKPYMESEDEETKKIAEMAFRFGLEALKK